MWVAWDVDSLLAREIELAGGVLARRDRPDLIARLGRARRSGEVVCLLRGVYARAPADTLAVRLLAAQRWDPNVVIGREAAAAVQFWPELRPSLIDLYLASDRKVSAGYRLHRCRPDPELVQTVGGLNFTTPALTAVDLCAEHGGEPIDRILRNRSARIEDLRSALALTSGRPGNVTRRRLLVQSRAEPWSAAERLGHELLFRARITGWLANYRVRVEGRTYYIDIAFPGCRVAVEIDGRFHETDPDIFESDRRRQNALGLEGWLVLRYTWATLTGDPDRYLREIRQALRTQR